MYHVTARSPTYSHLSSTLQGLPVIRAFNMEQAFIKTYYTQMNKQTSAWSLYLSAYRWFGQRLDWLVSIYLCGCILAAFFLDGKLEVNTVASVASIDGTTQSFVHNDKNEHTVIQIKSNQIKSNQIKSNQIKSNQIKSNQIKFYLKSGIQQNK